MMRMAQPRSEQPEKYQLDGISCNACSGFAYDINATGAPVQESSLEAAARSRSRSRSSERCLEVAASQKSSVLTSCSILSNVTLRWSPNGVVQNGCVNDDFKNRVL